VIANHAPLYFDNSTFDLYTAFKVGASLHLVHDELNVVMTKLISWIRTRPDTTFFCVPSVMTILQKSGDSKPTPSETPAHDRRGRVLHPDILREWMALYPHVQFTNMYGPTEITVDCTFHVAPGAPAEDVTVIPIGKPRTNMEVFVQLEDSSLCTSLAEKASSSYAGARSRTAISMIPSARVRRSSRTRATTCFPTACTAPVTWRASPTTARFSSLAAATSRSSTWGTASSWARSRPCS
jgi:hypothetical protein